MNKWEGGPKQGDATAKGKRDYHKIFTEAVLKETYPEGEGKWPEAVDREKLLNELEHNGSLTAEEIGKLRGELAQEGIAMEKEHQMGVGVESQPEKVEK